MSFGAPLLGLSALALGAVVVLYLVRVRRPDHAVPSTLLWQRSTRDRQASVPWQRLRPSWMLLLELLAATAMVLALTDPGVAAGGGLAARTVVAVDNSFTMQATDVSPSRFEAARTAARHLLEQASSADRITVIAMAGRAHVVADAQGTSPAIASALEALAPSAAAADLQGTLALATAAAAQGPAQLEVFSDGVTTPLSAPARLPLAVHYHPFGASTEDAGIAAMSVETGTAGSRCVVRVVDSGLQHRDLAVEFRVDGHLLDRKPVSVDGGGSRDLVFDVPATAGVVEARLDPPDAFPVDDVAVAVVHPDHTYRALVVTRRNAFLDAALRLRGDVSVASVPPADFRPDPTVDLYVFDGFVPPQLPDRPTLFVAPPADPRLGTGGHQPAGRLRAAETGDPLLQDVDLGAVQVARARSLQSSTFGRSLIDGEDGPVVMLREESPRAVLFAFDLHETDLPVRPAFPILMDRLSGFLLPAALPQRSHEPGDPIDIAAASSSAKVSVTGPDGRVVHLPAGGGVLASDDTATVGVYHVSLQDGSATRQSLFAVNAFAAAQAGITTHPSLSLAGTVEAPPPVGPPARRELWPFLVLLALAILLAEWTLWHRGG